MPGGTHGVSEAPPVCFLIVLLFCCVSVKLRGSRIATRKTLFEAFFYFFWSLFWCSFSNFWRPKCATWAPRVLHRLQNGAQKGSKKYFFFKNSEMSFGYSQCCICSTLGLPNPLPKRDENQSSHQEASRTSLLSIRTVLLPHFADFCTKMGGTWE